MPTAAHFGNFRLSSLGFSRVVTLEDLMSGEEILSCEEDYIAEGATLRSGKKLAGLAAKRAVAAGGDVVPSRNSPLIVVRNVELRIIRSEKHGHVNSVEVSALANVTIAPIHDLTSGSTFGKSPVKLSTALGWKTWTLGCSHPPVYLHMKDAVGAQSKSRVGEDAFFELGSPSLAVYGERIFVKELYVKPVVAVFREEGEEVCIEELRMEMVFARCVSDAELADLVLTMGQGQKSSLKLRAKHCAYLAFHLQLV
ncbi:hypothetical protein P7C70_g6236, partial [Phenoliferia sp. Uapishka_3]